MIKLKSIDEEAADCRKAFQHSKIGDLVQHCHHEVGCETLTQAAEDRIAYILSYKPVPEQALRLRLFRPIAVKGLPAEYQKARAELRKARAACRKARAEWRKAFAEWRKAYNASHSVLCKEPDCPWNGETIFA